MQQSIADNNVQEEEFSTKEKVVYSLLGAAGLTGLLILGVKGIRQLSANASEKLSFETGTPATYAKQIKMALENEDKYGIDVNAIRDVLRNIKSKQELELVRQEYKAQNKGKELYRELAALEPSEYNEFLMIMNGKPDANAPGISIEQYKSWAMRLQYAFINTWGYFNLPETDEDAIKAVFLEIPTKRDYKKVEEVYYQLYGETLWNDLQMDLELWELAPFMQIINSKPA